MDIEPGSPYLDAHVDVSLHNPRRWVKITTQNMDQYYFGDFIQSILYEFESHPAPGDADNQHVILWDNISLQKTAFVTNKIYEHASANQFLSV